MTSLFKSLRSSLDPYAVWTLNSMYDLSGTGKKGGLEYQLDLRIRHTCINAIGHNDGLFNTVVINVSNTRAFIYEDFQNPLRGFRYILFTIAEGRLVGIYPSVSLAYR